MRAESLPVVDLFCGAGGLSLGLTRVGFVPVAAVEIDHYACETYRSLHPRTDLLHADIRQVSFRRLRGEVAVVVGGPPCQPFSTGGLRRGAEDPRDGFPAFLHVLDEVQPDGVLIENVAGLGRGSTAAYLRALLDELADRGFVVSWTTLAATDFGVPQRRERVFIVGTRNGRFDFPLPTHGPGRRHPWLPAGSVLSVDEPFGDPNRSIVTYARKPDLRPSPYDGLLFNGGGRPIDLAAPARTILASAGGNKTPFVDTLRIVPAYHAHLMDGGRPRSGRVEGARRITVAESAALQTFPGEARFAGPRSAQYTLVGNAVPPCLAEAVGGALHDALTMAPRVRAA
ncbi:MAG TPA: DNA cytosine methyltransferase [Solirubrobacteraceae bacterium]|nr:DNA cytosine methyltransferase [Solirubrobacteraceae bacterium]